MAQSTICRTGLASLTDKASCSQSRLHGTLALGTGEAQVADESLAFYWNTFHKVSFTHAQLTLIPNIADSQVEN